MEKPNFIIFEVFPEPIKAMRLADTLPAVPI